MIKSNVQSFRYHLPVKVQAGTGLSDAVDVEGCTLVAIYIPPVMTSTGISGIQIGKLFDNLGIPVDPPTEYVEIRNTNNEEFSVSTFTYNAFMALDPRDLISAKYLKIEFNAIEAEERTVVLVVRPV